MTRASMYSLRQAGMVPVNVGIPIEGFWETRRLIDGTEVWWPIKIWLGFPVHPETGDVSERLWGWQCLLNGEAVDVWTCWPECSGRPIDEEQYLSMIEVNKHG